MLFGYFWTIKLSFWHGSSLKWDRLWYSTLASYNRWCDLDELLYGCFKMSYYMNLIRWATNLALRFLECQISTYLVVSLIWMLCYGGSLSWLSVFDKYCLLNLLNNCFFICVACYCFCIENFSTSVREDIIIGLLGNYQYDCMKKFRYN